MNVVVLRSAAGLAALAFVAAAALAQEYGQAPAPAVPLVKEGTAVKISEHVYVIPDEQVGMVPNVGIVVGTRGTLVWDPGMGRQSGEAVLREARKVGQGKDLYIVNSHFHPEHTTGEIAFPADAILIRAAAQQQDVEEMGMKWVQTFAKRSPVIAGVLDGFTAFRKPNETFEKERMIDLGGVYVRLIRLGPGHTRGDTIAYVEQDRVLFSGDLAMKGLFPAFSTPQSRVGSWLASLDDMQKLDPRTVVGAHYPTGDATMITDYRDYLKALQARVSELKREGKPAKDVAAQLKDEFAAQHKDWAQPVRIEAAALSIYQNGD